jgi:hypothetical protein
MEEKVPDGRPFPRFSDAETMDVGAAHWTDGVLEWPLQPLATSFGSEPIWISCPAFVPTVITRATKPAIGRMLMNRWRATRSRQKRLEEPASQILTNNRFGDNGPPTSYDSWQQR